MIRKASTLGEDASKEVADAFNDLKALYCRGLSNTAPQFRFSVRRLRLMAGLALEVEATLEQPGLVRVIEERAWYLGGEEVCGKLWSYLTAVHQFWADPSGRSVKITVTRPDEEYKITVEATYTGEPSPLSGGNSLKFIEVTKSKPPGDGLRVFGIKCTIRFKVAASGKREMMNLVVDDPSVDWRASR